MGTEKAAADQKHHLVAGIELRKHAAGGTEKIVFGDCIIQTRFLGGFYGGGSDTKN